jgi:hypothetical protein
MGRRTAPGQDLQALTKCLVIQPFGKSLKIRQNKFKNRWKEGYATSNVLGTVARFRPL